MRRRESGRGLLTLTFVLVLATRLCADGLRDNDPTDVRRVPRLGIELSELDRTQLQVELDALGAELARARSLDSGTNSVYPDVGIFHRAVEVALRHREFFAKGEVDAARELLAVGHERVAQVLGGKAPWREQTGRVVLGYLSRIDRSLQPFGLIVPPSYRPHGERRFRLDVWFHGRGETLSEVNFLRQRMKNDGQYTPRDTFVLHPYGRYSNAFKFAGEVDVLEAIDSVKARYRIDEDRVSVRGFSMGGAAGWQFAVHYADRWFAANPGAGFAETPEFLKFFQKETLDPPPWERELWHLYDCTDYASNLVHCPTIAYSGEMDIQKQAADIMARAMLREGMDLVHVIGPKTKHRIHPDSKEIIENRLASLAEVGRERFPSSVRLTTYTLTYNRMHWVTVDALGEHWKRARVEAEITAPDAMTLRTENVTELSLDFPPGRSPFDITRQPRLTIDDLSLAGPRPGSDRSWSCRLHRVDGRWRLGSLVVEGLRKRHDLQGPIDDAFMDSFIFVRPTGAAAHPRIERWSRAEFTHAVEHWRRQFRGDAIVKDDVEIGDQHVRDANLVLFGDPKSNAVLRKIVGELPVIWNEERLEVRGGSYDAADHAAILIYPNPLNPERYVVINSGFTYREYDYLNNARQVPKLPDWAIVDVRQPASTRYPGKIIAADFFDEEWALR